GVRLDYGTGAHGGRWADGLHWTQLDRALRRWLSTRAATSPAGPRASASRRHRERDSQNGRLWNIRLPMRASRRLEASKLPQLGPLRNVFGKELAELDG